MKKTFSLLVIGCTLFSSVCLSTAAQAGVWPEKPFTAIYESTSSFGKSTRKVVWDGQGHGRTEMTSTTGVRLGFLDAPNHLMTMCTPPSEAIRIPLSDQDIEQLGIAAQNNITGRKSLGTKLIDGHLCQGQRYSLGEFTTEAWMDPEIKCNRLTVTTHPTIGVSTSRLINYSGARPDSSAFAIPPGYKLRGG